MAVQQARQETNPLIRRKLLILQSHIHWKGTFSRSLELDAVLSRMIPGRRSITGRQYAQGWLNPLDIKRGCSTKY